jgi:UDP-3-O-acyl N-acetylglycosamine deacetylase
MRIVPAPAGTGICFRRSDLDSFDIEAVGRNVARVSYATSLMKKGVLISTTEHVLSAFVGAGIDNAIVELDMRFSGLAYASCAGPVHTGKSGAPLKSEKAISSSGYILPIVILSLTLSTFLIP